MATIFGSPSASSAVFATSLSVASPYANAIALSLMTVGPLELAAGAGAVVFATRTVGGSVLPATEAEASSIATNGIALRSRSYTTSRGAAPPSTANTGRPAARAPTLADSLGVDLRTRTG